MKSRCGLGPAYRGALLAGLLTGLVSSRADAACNIIPPAVETFRGTLASSDRPFARPGDWVRLTVAGDCATSSPGFVGAAEDYVVTVVFTPPNAGRRNVVVLAANCGAVDTASCAARTDVDTAACVTANAPGLPVSLEKIDQKTLRFRFPDTDPQLMAGNDDLTFTGPVSIAVSAATSPLPCSLATLSCDRQPGVLACVDRLFAGNGTCNTEPHAMFSHFTALPPPNDYQAMCTTVPPCTGLADEVRFTVDATGNILLPVDWRGVRVDRDAVPVARLLRASSTVEAFEGRGIPIQISDLASLGSYSAEGVRLPPLFDPQQDPSDTNAATFFGSTDAEESVLRLAPCRAVESVHRRTQRWVAVHDLGAVHCGYV